MKLLKAQPLYDEKIQHLSASLTRRPRRLAVVRFEDNPGNAAYLKGIQTTADKIGMSVEVIDASPNEALETVERLNYDATIHGILIFRPLPPSINEQALNLAIDPNKDVDCMNPLNSAKLYMGDTSGFVPLAPKASMELLHYYGYTLQGKNCVIVNHSNVVGKPLAMLLLAEGATVTICHDKTVDLKAYTQKADFVFTATGQSEYFDGSYFKDGAVAIDIGIARSASGKLTGDLKSQTLDLLEAYSPVPGGIGSLTSLMLLESIVNR
ncbi:bifunctional 5,10-methylenetetrahydrofolate dehydrogenase/5,10-methenyltetrahydrofolate cyclohydrolase [Peptoniphilus equinus]|uniref:Bifunctional protein FolD n=1 Tax=Peptoniphilus equinus TaxID=3016343 RepID=A0ABY7QUF4_9FIRM|nr:bifunctional 5,10-methylenetetrahydrofolate dehydrogenase/5,10-methenyltetrahydrofolate cyclohydrolase [Peptoniphilus equinus]WBW50406.1 bifunctional 5,10-methylenetetrahydrofolate dehydrogenase/5,10-methenyltetrahydrofolate cyclohydrolase [Peptoniphilus equinus]